jgi:hypothetical protein
MKNKDFKFLIILIILMILNVIDAIATVFWIENQLATESNPLMEILLNISPTIFIIMKIVLVFLCATLLWILRRRNLTFILLTPVILIYCYVSLKHFNIAWNVFFVTLL